MIDIAAKYSRGQLATETGVKAETIRYYEKCGLLDAPDRSAGGHRIYSDVDARKLVFIRRCRELGFSLIEIEQLLGLADVGEKSCEQVQRSTQTHLDDVQCKIRDLRKMERTLKDMINRCEENVSASCPIIESLYS